MPVFLQTGRSKVFMIPMTTINASIWTIFPNSRLIGKGERMVFSFGCSVGTYIPCSFPTPLFFPADSVSKAEIVRSARLPWDGKPQTQCSTACSPSPIASKLVFQAPVPLLCLLASFLPSPPYLIEKYRFGNYTYFIINI